MSAAVAACEGHSQPQAPGQGAAPTSTAQEAGADATRVPGLAPPASVTGDASAAEPAAPVPEPPSAASRRLFNGTNLDGWKVFVPGDEDTSSLFVARDGVLICEGRPIGYIATTEQFESFELELEWRFDPERGAGNSGVLLRVADEDHVWPRSIEAQLHSGNAGDIWNIGEVPMQVDPDRTEGRRTRKMAESSERPLGEWNHYRIVLDGGALELHVNGVLQNTAEACEVRPGRVALQSEGAFIEFRNITLRPLPGTR
ncbi:MAG: DUF1080 domain-containing protein [Phycisphaeraceae bacterium]|nr:DUF1080 domain-containing protein [Phycisphaeraceae bacterium]